MAVLGNRGTGLLDMAIEAFRNQGQQLQSPPMASPAPMGTTPLQRAMGRQEVAVSMPEGRVMSSTTPQGQMYLASTTPQVQQAMRGTQQPVQERTVAVNTPQVSTARPDMGGAGVVLTPQQQALRERPAPELGADMQKIAEDADRAVKAGAADSSDPTIMEGIKSYFGSRENMLRLAMAFNTMRLQPDAQLTAALSKELENVGKNTRAAQAAAELRAKGTKPALQAAQYIEQTGDIAGGIKMFREAGRFKQLTGAQLQAMGIAGFDKDKVYNYDSITDKVSSIGGGDTVIQMGPKEGKLSTDFTFARDAEGNILYEQSPEGYMVPKAIPVPGSPAAQAAEQTAEKELGRKVQRERAGGTVIQDIQRGLDLIPELSTLEAQTGIVGANARALARDIEGTTTNKIHKFKESALSNVGLDTLQQMRENSPTGGALGQVPIQQQQRLEQVLGSLDVTQELPILEQNMQRVINIYLDIVYGAKAERDLLVQKGQLTEQENAEIESFYYDLPFDPLGREIQTQIPKPDDIDQAVWDAMKPEQKALWK